MVGGAYFAAESIALPCCGARFMLSGPGVVQIPPHPENPIHAHIRDEKNSNVAQFYHRISKKKGNSKAAVAAASKLLKIVYWIMKEKRSYNKSE